MNKIKSGLSSLLNACFILFFSLSSLINPSWAGSPYSTRELDELEKEFIQQINQSNSVLRNPLAIQYINHLGKTLARNAQEPIPTFFIVKSNEINAFAGPGGYIGINTQLILASDNESELAAVMAHEMAHVRLHHLYRMIEHEKQMRIPMIASVLASIALGVLNPTLGQGALMASLTGMAQSNINFIRSNEKEADRIGIDMLIKSGLDPRGMAGFFKKLQESTRYYYMDNIPAILRTHPLDDDRIAEAESRSLHLIKKNYPDNLDYHLFKELVRASTGINNKLLSTFYPAQCRRYNTDIACQYGHVVQLINNYHFEQAEQQLIPLLRSDPDNLYFNIAMAEAQIGTHKYDSAIPRLRELHDNYPDNYAAAVTLGDGLVAASKPDEAVSILLKASRKFKNDLPICQQLAQAQAAAHRKDYAYFTQANCELLQGRKKGALSQLYIAKKLAKKDHLLQARIDATIDDIKQ